MRFEVLLTRPLPQIMSKEIEYPHSSIQLLIGSNISVGICRKSHGNREFFGATSVQFCFARAYYCTIVFIHSRRICVCVSTNLSC